MAEKLDDRPRKRLRAVLDNSDGENDARMLRVDDEGGGEVDLGTKGGAEDSAAQRTVLHSDRPLSDRGVKKEQMDRLAASVKSRHAQEEQTSAVDKISSNNKAIAAEAGRAQSPAASEGDESVRSHRKRYNDDKFESRRSSRLQERGNVEPESDMYGLSGIRKERGQLEDYLTDVSDTHSVATSSEKDGDVDGSSRTLLQKVRLQGCCMYLPPRHRGISTELLEALTPTPQARIGVAQEPVEMYRYESRGELVIPRHFGVEKLGKGDWACWPPLSCPSSSFCRENGSSSSRWREGDQWSFNGKLNELQVTATKACMDSFDKHRGGILSMYCGGGKTVCALFLAAQLRRKTLVVVGKSFLCDQWEERARQFLPRARLGRLRQGVVDVAGKDVVIGMLQSLVSRGHEYPTQEFGMVIVDECHHICARSFSRALFTIAATPGGGVASEGAASASAASCAACLPAHTSDVCLLGLSATPHRKDGLTPCLHWFFGPLAFVATRPPMRGVQVHSRCFASGQTFSNAHFADEVNRLTENRGRNELICGEVWRCWCAGRRILLLSDRRQHLEDLKSMLCSPPHACPPIPSHTIGLYVGGVKGCVLESVTSKCRIILATYGMCSEGLDIPTLNTLILATPRAAVTQSVGRILRAPHAPPPRACDASEGDRVPPLVPLVIDIVDVATSRRLDRLARARSKEFVKAGFTISFCSAAVPQAAVGVPGEWGHENEDDDEELSAQPCSEDEEQRTDEEQHQYKDHQHKMSTSRAATHAHREEGEGQGSGRLGSEGNGCQGSEADERQGRERRPPPQATDRHPPPHNALLPAPACRLCEVGSYGGRDGLDESNEVNEERACGDGEAEEGPSHHHARAHVLHAATTHSQERGMGLVASEAGGGTTTEEEARGGAAAPPTRLKRPFGTQQDSWRSRSEATNKEDKCGVGEEGEECGAGEGEEGEEPSDDVLDSEDLEEASDQVECRGLSSRLLLDIAHLSYASRDPKTRCMTAESISVPCSESMSVETDSSHHARLGNAVTNGVHIGHGAGADAASGTLRLRQEPCLDVMIGETVSTKQKQQKQQQQQQHQISQQQQSSQKAAFDLLWEHKLRELKVFRAENGHCCVSQKITKTEEQLANNLLSLGVWVKEQRQQHKKGKLSEERRRKLDEIGFTWDGTKAQALRHGALREQQQSGQSISKEPEKKSGWLQHLKQISRDT